MDKNHRQAYLSLIEDLLNSANDQELRQILADNMQLVNQELLETCKAVLAIMVTQGQNREAKFLRIFMSQLEAILVNSPQSPKNISQFLMQVLQLTSDSNGNSSQVYSLLAANTEKLTLIFAELLREWVKQKLLPDPSTTTYKTAIVIGNFSNLIQNFSLGNKSNNLEIAIAGYESILMMFTHETFPQNWAAVQNNLGTAYHNRIRGEKSENLEIAIRSYQGALEVYNRAAFPQEWAATQNDLAIVYTNRILGDKAENLETAIRYYQAVLELSTRAAFPLKWATTQNNLGIVYSDRILGDKAENLETAIHYYQSALELRTRDAFPEDWAATQNNLGVAYRNRIFGDKAENVETAIRYYQAALEARTRDAFPEDWAATQNNLGSVYSDRILGDQAQNLETAITYYQGALEIYTRAAFPQNWAMVQNNLGSVYSDRILGDQAQNLETAITYYQGALEIYTREAFPQNWAMVQNNLATAYRDRIRGEKAENLETAITYYQGALEIYTREAFPQNWAMVQNNLATAYRDRIRGEKAENLETAISYYQASLDIHTRQAFPEDWAGAQYNLGIAYRDRIRGEKAENLETAITYYQAALEIRTRQAFPQNYAETLFSLGKTYQQQIAYYKTLSVNQAKPSKKIQKAVNNFLQNAYASFADAIDTVEFLRGEIYSGDESKQKLAETWNQLYQAMVEVCLDMERYNQAIEYVERSKARNLVELITTHDVYPQGTISQKVLDHLDLLRRKITAERRRFHNEKASLNSRYDGIIPKGNQQNNQKLASIRDSTQLNQLQQQLDEFIAREITPIDPKSIFSQKAELILYSEIKTLTNEKRAILEWCITGDKFLTFIITPESKIVIPWKSSKEDFKALVNWRENYLRTYLDEDKYQWRKDLASRLRELSQILHLDEIFAHIPPTVEELILIPHRFLHLFPLHALTSKRCRQKPDTGEIYTASGYLLDLFEEGVRYAPSCQLLQQAQNRKRDNFSHLFAIQNPTNDLTYTDLEVQAISKYFQLRDILANNAAKIEALEVERLRKAHCTHFSCHGYFNFANPLQSALLFADCFISPPPADPEPSRYLRVDNDTVLDLSKCLTLENIFTRDLSACRLVVLSACETGLTDFQSISDEYIGLPSGFLVAGSSSVVSSLWAVNDLSTSLSMIKFYENLHKGLTVTLALNHAQTWLRDATKAKLETCITGLPLNAAQRMQFRAIFYKIEANTKPFESPFYWAAFCAIGQ